MATLEQLRGQIESTGELRSVVKTMKALAAVHIRQYERAVDALREYERNVERGLQIVLRQLPPDALAAWDPGGGAVVAVVLGSDQGLAGPFDQRVAARAASVLRPRVEQGDTLRLLAVGERVAGALRQEGLPVHERRELPRSLEGFPAALGRLLPWIEDTREAIDAGEVVVLFNRPASGASFRATARWLWPLDPRRLRELRRRSWEGGSEPVALGDRRAVLRDLVLESFHVLLHGALAASRAAENASRIASMQAAEDNIEARLEELDARFRHSRQSQITSELLDIVSGFEALREPGGEDGERGSTPP